jgi:hypothetical protein
MGVKTGAETRCKGEIMSGVPPSDSQGMRYYPAFGVKSGLDARFRRYLSSGIHVLTPFVIDFFLLTDQS